MPNTVNTVGKHSEKSIICLSGPTAVGKTALAIKLAQALGTEIISFDSRQFYREIPIGTAAPTAEERSVVPHHFILDRSIHDPLNAADFAEEALSKIATLHQKYQSLILVGGSGLYLKALIEGFDAMPEVSPNYRLDLMDDLARYGLAALQAELEKSDPEYYAQVDQQNPQRIIRALEIIRGTGKKFSSFRLSQKRELSFKVQNFALNLEREILYDRINRRVDIMLQDGLYEEAKAMYPYRNLNALQTVGYRELFAHFEGEYDLARAADEIRKNSRRYAKRQITWFKRQADIEWLAPQDWEQIIARQK